jgi:hypothetical protein
MKKIILIVISIGMLLTFTGCGGGGGSSAAGDNSNPPSNPIGGTETEVSGRVADGYLVGAKICLDINNNRKCDINEPFDITEAGGKYTISSSQYNTSDYDLFVEIDVTTIDEDTNLSVGSTYTLSSPAGMNFVSPISDLIKTTMDNNNSVTLDAAKLYVSQELNISIDEIQLDYIETGATGIHTKAQNMVKVKQTITDLKGTYLSDNPKLSPFIEDLVAKNVYAEINVSNLNVSTLSELVKEKLVEELFSKGSTVDELDNMFYTLSTVAQDRVKSKLLTPDKNPYVGIFQSGNGNNGGIVIKGSTDVEENLSLYLSNNWDYRLVTEPFEVTQWDFTLDEVGEKVCSIRFLNSEELDWSNVTLYNVTQSGEIQNKSFSISYGMETIEFMDIDVTCVNRNKEVFDNVISPNFSDLVGSDSESYSKIVSGWVNNTDSLITNGAYNGSKNNSTDETKLTISFNSNFAEDTLYAARRMNISMDGNNVLEVSTTELYYGASKLVVSYNPNDCSVVASFELEKDVVGTEDFNLTSTYCVDNVDNYDMDVKMVAVKSNKLYYDHVNVVFDF